MTHQDDKPHRWRELVYRAIESDTLDYKSALNWNLLPRSGKAKFVRHCLALANTKGGYVVVGVSEDSSGRPVVYAGLTPEESKSFDPSNVGPFINRCVEPPVDFTIERPIVDGKQYAIFVVKPFVQQPHVCSLGIVDELQPGVFYIRTTDASSRPAYRASEIHALIQRALRKQRELLSRMLRGLLFENRQNDDENEADHFAEESLHSRNFFRRKGVKSTDGFYVELAARPARYRADYFSRAELSDAITQTPGLAPVSQWYGANTSWRRFLDGETALQQFYRSGLFYQLQHIPSREMRQLRTVMVESITVIGALYAAAGLVDEALALEVRLYRSDWAEDQLHLRTPRRAVASAASTDLVESGWYSAVSWHTAPDEHALELFERLLEKFQAEI